MKFVPPNRIRILNRMEFRFKSRLSYWISSQIAKYEIQISCANTNSRPSVNRTFSLKKYFQIVIKVQEKYIRSALNGENLIFYRFANESRRENLHCQCFSMVLLAMLFTKLFEMNELKSWDFKWISVMKMNKICVRNLEYWWWFPLELLPFSSLSPFIISLSQKRISKLHIRNL